MLLCLRLCSQEAAHHVVLQRCPVYQTQVKPPYILVPAGLVWEPRVQEHTYLHALPGFGEVTVSLTAVPNQVGAGTCATQLLGYLVEAPGCAGFPAHVSRADSLSHSLSFSSNQRERDVMRAKPIRISVTLAQTLPTPCNGKGHPSGTLGNSLPLFRLLSCFSTSAIYSP